MLSFKSILFGAAAFAAGDYGGEGSSSAFASIVSAIPTPETGNSLNTAQRSPGGLPIVGGDGIGNLPVIGDSGLHCWR